LKGVSSGDLRAVDQGNVEVLAVGSAGGGLAKSNARRRTLIAGSIVAEHADATAQAFGSFVPENFPPGNVSLVNALRGHIEFAPPGGTGQIVLRTAPGSVADTIIRTFYLFGPEPDNPGPHWFEFFFEFFFDGQDGAVPNADGSFTLHFSDGGRGDLGPAGDGTVTFSGATAVVEPAADLIVKIKTLRLLADGTLEVLLSGAPGKTYSLGRSPDLSPGSFIEVDRGVANAAGDVTLTDSNVPANSAFYRGAEVVQ
jgi:hypothetical protein